MYLIHASAYAGKPIPDFGVMIGGCQGSMEPRTEAAGIPLFLSSPGDLRPNQHDTAPQKRGILASCQKVNTVHVPGHIGNAL
jgi:hypothetical protein